MTAAKLPAQTLDERLRAATCAFLVRVARDPHEHPATREAARQRLLMPSVDDLPIATLPTDALRLIRDAIAGRIRYEAISAVAQSTVEPARDVQDPAVAPASDEPNSDEDRAV